MKKSILILGTLLMIFSLTAFGYVNWNNIVADPKVATCSKTTALDNDLVSSITKPTDSELVYIVDSRFTNTVTKEKLHNARSIIDILPKKATQSIVKYYSSGVSILEDGKETDQLETGNSAVLNEAQIKLLRSMDYSTELFITADCRQKNSGTGKLLYHGLTYSYIIVPENEATYADGIDVLIDYLKRGSKEKVEIIEQDKLRFGRVNFTISKNGTIEQVRLNSTSGYPSIDEVLVDLITNMPEKWNPATNSKGEKVDQEMVFFFGKAGC